MKTKITKSELKKLFRQNLYQVLLVFAAFIAMILVSVFYVGNIVSAQMHDLAEQTITTTQTAVNGTLNSSGLLFSDVVRSTAEKLEAGKDDPEANTPVTDDELYGNLYTNLEHEILNYLRSIHNYYITDSSPIAEFMKIYGYINGKFIDGSDWIPGKEYNPKERVWYKGAVSNNGERYFSEPYEDADSGEMCISFSQLIGEVRDDSDVLAIDLDLSGITGYIQTQKIANNGYGLFVSDQFTFAAHKNQELLGKHMRDAGGEYEKLFAALKAGENVSGLRFKDYNGVDSIAFFHSLYSGWYVGIVTPYSGYTSSVTIMAVIISLLGVALAVLLSFLLLRVSYERIKSEEESQSKSTFLARMSHEMRTPMNAIIGMTEIAKSTHDLEKIEYCMDKINAASKHLLGVINDVLDMSKIEADKLQMNYSDFAIADMINQVQTVMFFKLEEKKQTLAVDVLPSVPKAIISDQQRLAQVLTNLVSNANKFSPEGSVIRINVTAEESGAGKYIVHFEVIDKGIGISKEAKDRLFHSFEQADGSISRKFGGTGLGLVISKSIVEMLGGEIKVESEPGAGSTFYFSITAEKGSAQAESRGGEADDSEPLPGMFKGMHILIAEDVQINVEILVTLLEETGISIDTAENGRIAVEMFSSDPGKYDLIFMDMQMPEMDGLDATRSIRALNDPRAKTVPIVAMTANVFKEDIDRCLTAGMNDHTGKPIEINDVIAKIKKYTRF